MGTPLDFKISAFTIEVRNKGRATAEDPIVFAQIKDKDTRISVPLMWTGAISGTSFPNIIRTDGETVRLEDAGKLIHNDFIARDERMTKIPATVSVSVLLFFTIEGTDTAFMGCNPAIEAEYPLSLDLCATVAGDNLASNEALRDENRKPFVKLVRLVDWKTAEVKDSAL